MTKRFGAVTALDAVDFALQRGEVRALLGKNGAGKSTIVNLISGSLNPATRSSAHGQARPVDRPPGAAQAGGIAVVHQEFCLVPGLSVAENITGPLAAPRRIRPARASCPWARSARSAGSKSAIPLFVEVGMLALAEQQIVEIARRSSTSRRCSSSTSPPARSTTPRSRQLLRADPRLAQTGMAVIYVSHRMKEIPLVADSLTVLRDGRLVATHEDLHLSSAQVAELISGDSKRGGSGSQPPRPPRSSDRAAGSKPHGAAPVARCLTLPPRGRGTRHRRTPRVWPHGAARIGVRAASRSGRQCGGVRQGSRRSASPRKMLDMGVALHIRGPQGRRDRPDARCGREPHDDRPRPDPSTVLAPTSYKELRAHGRRDRLPVDPGVVA